MRVISLLAVFFIAFCLYVIDTGIRRKPIVARKRRYGPERGYVFISNEEKIMETAERKMKYRFLMGAGMSVAETLIAEQLIDSLDVDNPDYFWEKERQIMLEQFQYTNNKNPARLIQCHLMCASRAPHSYGNLAKLTLTEAYTTHVRKPRFDLFCQYSVIGVLRAGILLQNAHQTLIGGDFELCFASFIFNTMVRASVEQPWSTGDEGTLGLMDAAVKGYFRPQDHVAKTLLAGQIHRMLKSLQGMPLGANGNTENSAEVFGPGVAIFRSLMFTLLDIDRRAPGQLVDLLLPAFPSA